MRSRFFGNKIKSTFLIALSLLLILPTFLNLFLAPSASASAETCDGKGDNCRIIVVKANGSTDKITPYTALAIVVSDNKISYTIQGPNSDGDSNITITSGSASKSTGSFDFAEIDQIEIYASDGTTLIKSQKLSDKTGTISLATAMPDAQYQETVKCQAEYKNEWDKVNKYYEENYVNKGIADAAAYAIANFLATHAPTAANAYTLNGTTGITCHKDKFKADWDKVVSENGLTGDDLPVIDGTYTPLNPGTGGGTDIPQTEATCHSTSGAMGWFICPVLEFAASASAWIYEYVIEPSLVIRSELFRTDNSGSKGTFKAWSVFRDIANIIFAVLLLFVIFSQITGIGIDNYGIKKTLPNLIVAAILVNLSYIICQALVDVSNIAGGGLYGLISRITATPTYVPNTDVAGIGFSTSIIFTIAVAVGGLTATGVAVGGLGAFWSLVGGALLAVLPALIGALVAVVFLFFMLAMRQTMVVLLVVISPLAFVCYTLPNTKNLFNRWAQLMRGMLLLYPICALMIAGGRLASKIILASGAAENNLFIILVAMVAEAGPLFLIPGLTRSAYRATGQLGATLNGFRGRLAGGARHMIAGNPAFHRAIDRNRFERIGNRNNRILSRYEESAKNLASGTGGLRDRFRARQTTGNLERITEARKMQVAAEQRQQEIAKWAGTATTDSTGREIRDVSGNLITQGQAIVNAQIANAQLNTEGEVARANLMNNVQYQDTRRTQTAKTISEETTKMYADSYSRMSVTQLQTALAGAVNAAPGSANQSEQISAAIRTFSSIGQMDKARDVLNANSAGMQAYATSNAENRNRLVQELGGSGDWIMREYSKHIAKQAEIPGGVVKDFSSWSNSADAAADSSLAASLRKRGVSALADLDKDSIEYVTNNANALNAVSADAFASAAANTTNGEIITKLSNAIERLDDAKRQTIVNNTSADQFVRMSDDIRSTLALGHRSAPGHRTDGRIRVVFNAQINDLRQPANSQIAARLSSQDRARFGV